MRLVKKTYIHLLALMLVICFSLTGCIFGNKQYEVPSYQGQIKEGKTKADYNQELFYRNDKKIDGADPFVFDNTKNDGYYYAFVTNGSCFVSRSKNMMEWESVGNALDNYMYAEDGSSTEVRNVTSADVWAPEVVYDEDTELYYLFFSATPKEDTNVKAEGKVTGGTARYQLMVAVSKYPDHDYQLVDFSNTKSCGQGNEHSFDIERFPHYYAKYLMLNPENYSDFMKATLNMDLGTESGGYLTAIDPHPFVDSDGQKYLFWVRNTGLNHVIGVKMENWLKPDWSTVQVVATGQYYTVEDYLKSLKGEYVDTVAHEEGSSVNEGPCIKKHNNKYYLTLSSGTYGDNTYRVTQAIADSPLGPYRKLRSEEGGVLLSGALEGNQAVSGTGHHSFVTVGEQEVIVYHRHNSTEMMGNSRNVAMDEIKWITIKDIDGNDLEVMYVNGATSTVQPKLELYSDYKNIADEAKISCSDSKEIDLSYLTDDLLSLCKMGDPVALVSVGETQIDTTSTFTFDFDTARTVRAVMVYSSKSELKAFTKIARIEFTCEENDKTIKRFIKDIDFPSDCFKMNDIGGLQYIVPGAAGYAEFDEMTVKQIRITIEVPKNQELVGISEIRILGK